MNILKTIQNLFSGQSFNTMTVEGVLRIFQDKFAERKERIAKESGTVFKSLVFQQKEFSIRLKKAQFDKQLQALLPYVVNLKRDGQFLHEGQRLIEACNKMLTGIREYSENHQQTLAQKHETVLQESEAYHTFFEKMERYNKLNQLHERQLYGDAKELRKAIVKKAEKLLKSAEAEKLSGEAFLQQKKQWILEEVAEVFKEMDQRKVNK